jgi:hypothetical protein
MVKGLALRPEDGSAAAAKVSGKTYEFPGNDHKLEALRLATDGKDGGTTLVARFDGTEYRIDCTRAAWHKGRGGWGRLSAQPVAASGAWTADDTFTARLCFYETPFIVTVRLTFAGDEVRCEYETNVGFGTTRQTPLVGKAK